MRAVTHELGGLTAGLTYSLLLGLEPKEAVITSALSAAGALIPDIDHRGSKISKKLRITSAVVSAATHHRGVCHTPILYLAAFVLGIAFVPSLYGVWIGLFLGAMSHIFLDMFNPTGVPVLYPVTNKKYHLASIKTGSLKEQGVKVLLLVIVLVLAYLIFADGVSVPFLENVSEKPQVL